MTKEEALSKFAQRCKDSIPPIECDPFEFISVEIPDGIMVGDMFKVVEYYKSQGWVVSMNHDGSAWWFVSRGKLKADVRAVCLKDQKRLVERGAELRQMIDDLSEEDEAVRRVRDERIETIDAGKLPIMGTPN